MASPPTPPSTSSPTQQRKLKILMLHGYQQSGPLFHAKTRALEKALQKAFPTAPAPGHLAAYPGGISLVYPTAPIRLHATDLPGAASSSNQPSGSDGGPSPQDTPGPDAYGWWIRNEQSGTYTHFERGLACIAEVLQREGDVAGVMGFSQGGGATGIVASLLEPGRPEAFAAAAREEGGQPAMEYPASFLRHTDEGEGGAGRIHPPLKFGVVYSGMAADKTPLYRALYTPKIETPLLHFIGSLDVLVEESRSLALVDRCLDWSSSAKAEEDPGETEAKEKGHGRRVVYHPGGHFLPTQKQYLGIVVGFIREILGREGEL